MRRFALLLLAFALPAAAHAADTGAPTASARLQNPQGQPVGEAQLRETPGGVLLALTLRTLPPGPHAFHVHETGKCEGAGGFKSAGGHFNPHTRKHGFESAEGFHAGDLPNVVVGADGTATVEVLIAGVTLAAGKPSSLLDADGSALMVHAGPDDYRTDPAGNAGDRIACAVVERATR